MRAWNGLALCLAVAGCSGGAENTLPDESGDLGEIGTARRAAGPRVGPEVDGTRWRWVEGHCTEGPLTALTARGFEQELRVAADAEGLLLTYDQKYGDEECVNTVVQRARPATESQEFTMSEEIRIAQPASRECAGEMEPERPGEVRKNGEFLEVLVQRSRIWCNGLEVRMVYAPMPGAPLTNDQIVRRYAAHFNRRDSQSVAKLFAETGSLVEPFNVTHTGGASRHDGRSAVEGWYRETFAGVEWLALQLDAIEEASGNVVVNWSYIDPRLEEPFRGRNHFTIAAGEIYESRIELTEEPPELVAPEEEGDGEGEAEEEG